MKTHSWEEIKATDPDVNTPEYRAAYTQARLELDLGARVRELRTAAGLSQSQLARLVGTRQPNIARLEAGGGMPRLETLQRIADALGVRFAVSLGPTPRRRRSATRTASDRAAAFRRGITTTRVAGAPARAVKAAAAPAKAVRAPIAKAAPARTSKTAKAAPVAKAAKVTAKAAPVAKAAKATSGKTGKAAPARGRAARSS